MKSSEQQCSLLFSRSNFKKQKCGETRNPVDLPLMRSKLYRQKSLSDSDRDFYLEQTVELGVDLVCDGSEVFGAVFVVEVVGFDDEDLAFVVGDPLLVAVVEVAEVLDADALFIVASALLDLRHEGRDGGLQVDEEIRLADHRHHQIKEVLVGVEGPV